MTATMSLDAARFVIPNKQRAIAYNAPSALAFRWFFKRLSEGRDLGGPRGVTVRHEGRCGRCGRTLTVPASIDSGIGPDCAERMGRPWGEGSARPFDVREYVLAGNATFTLTSNVTGNRLTFKVSRAEGREDDQVAPYFVSVLTGPDNSRDYTWLGMIFPG